MNTKEIGIIIDLQKRGLGYKKIAALTGLPVNGVKSYCRRHRIDHTVIEGTQVFCRGCGKPINRLPGAKPRQFCGDECRMRFWNSHRDEINHKTVYKFVCPYCGREFQSFGNPNRKYCSRDCVANSRRKGGEADGR